MAVKPRPLVSWPGPALPSPKFWIEWKCPIDNSWHRMKKVFTSEEEALAKAKDLAMPGDTARIVKEAKTVVYQFYTPSKRNQKACS